MAAPHRGQDVQDCRSYIIAIVEILSVKICVKAWSPRAGLGRVSAEIFNARAVIYIISGI